ncbi:hypothetical protein NPS53_09010 [Pseudomonas putida]|uniref:hypothetical protein n=1 Tax=Pseudomonas putida TaxID=303 RepID=UPI00236399C1|nr:hypothetical protein [Pseudomonas putida]MDD2139714.1 hypothetical protein [Pseudomonas putida]HDS1721638.1 hypothetical protein [Pseudomonas putida]
MTAPTPYTIELHRHNFARWAAARAYTRGLKGGGNQLAFNLIDVSGLQSVTGPSNIEPDVDGWLLSYMRTIFNEARRRGVDAFSFGHAQKLVNIYLKSVLVCGEHYDHELVKKLHPPLDDQLFRGLKAYFRKHNPALSAAATAFDNAQKKNSKWTSFTEADYTAHIAAIKTLMIGRPLYEAEEHWRL